MQIQKREIEVYVTSDRREFENKSDAEQHEKYLPLSRYHAELRSAAEFLVTPQHVAAIKRMNFWWQVHRSGFPECNLDCKRPFGNSDIEGDLAEILDIPVPDYEQDEEFTEEQVITMKKFFLELWVVLDILLATCELKPGQYQRKYSYTNEWELVASAS